MHCTNTNPAAIRPAPAGFSSAPDTRVILCAPYAANVTSPNASRPVTNIANDCSGSFHSKMSAQLIGALGTAGAAGASAPRAPLDSDTTEPGVTGSSLSAGRWSGVRAESAFLLSRLEKGLLLGLLLGLLPPNCMGLLNSKLLRCDNKGIVVSTQDDPAYRGREHESQAKHEVARASHRGYWAVHARDLTRAIQFSSNTPQHTCSSPKGALDCSESVLIAEPPDVAVPAFLLPPLKLSDLPSLSWWDARGLISKKGLFSARSILARL